MFSKLKFLPCRSFPLVIIQSESERDDTVKNIFPPELITQLNIQHAQMNAVAATNLVITDMALLEEY
jgi:hypothetical protein